MALGFKSATGVVTPQPGVVRQIAHFQTILGENHPLSQPFFLRPPQPTAHVPQSLRGQSHADERKQAHDQAEHVHGSRD
jgi:hypothetical protein